MNRTRLYRLFNERSYQVGAEVGVAYGNNAVNMLNCIPGLKLYLVDPWTGTARTPKFYRTVLRRARQNLQPFQDRVVWMHMKSERAALDLPEDSLDFVYIDGDHNYDAVMLDIILWERRVRPGGILAGHDYVGTRFHGVKRAVDDYALYHNRRLKVLKGNWYWWVT
jgi:predicted O-methyltransferase YrrM